MVIFGVTEDYAIAYTIEYVVFLSRAKYLPTEINDTILKIIIFIVWVSFLCVCVMFHFEMDKNVKEILKKTHIWKRYERCKLAQNKTLNPSTTAMQRRKKERKNTHSKWDTHTYPMLTIIKWKEKYKILLIKRQLGLLCAFFPEKKCQLINILYEIEC